MEIASDASVRQPVCRVLDPRGGTPVMPFWARNFIQIEILALENHWSSPRDA